MQEARTAAHGEPHFERKIRLAILIWKLKPAGAERQLLELARRIDRSRYDACVIVCKPSEFDAQCALPVYSLLGPGKARLGAGLFCFFRLLWVLRKFRPDILHSFLPEITLIFGAFGARILRVPAFVCNRRSNIALTRKGWFLKLFEPWATRLTDEMAVNAESVRLDLQAVDGFPADRICVIPNAVDVERFRPGLPSRMKEFGWPAESFVIGIVANFRDCKRHNDFVQSASIMNRKHPGARFLLVGNDLGTLPEVRRLILKLGLQDVTRVITGCASPEEIYGTMDALVCTSETEGLSNVLLEGMACGLAIVATAVGGNPEALEDGVQGLLVPVRDPTAVASAIERLIQEPELRKRMGVAGRMRAVERFSMDAMVSGFDELYERALQRGRP